MGQLHSVLNAILPDPSSSSDESTSPHSTTDGYHHPTPTDVQLVQDILIQYLPVELIDSIIDLAEYWPRVVSSVGYEPPQAESEGEDGEGEVEAVIEGEECFRVEGRNAEEARWCAVVTEPLMLGGGAGGEAKRRRVRKVRFEIVSHDQGWSGEPERLHGTYQASYTWFQASIIRARSSSSSRSLSSSSSAAMPGSDPQEMPQQRLRLRDAVLATVPPFDFIPFTKGYLALGIEGDDDLGPGGRIWRVQTNMHARRDWKRYVVEWDAHGHDDGVDEVDVEAGAGKGRGFVDEIGEGDRVVLWACAQYQAWANYVRFAKVEVFYSV